MAFCPAATVTAAIFTALVVLDIVNKNYKNIGFHISGGIFSVIGIFVMCNALGDMAGWALLGVPFVVLLVGFLLIWIDGRKDSVASAPEDGCSSQAQSQCGCPTEAKEQAPLPPSVTNLPPRTPESTIGCPSKA